MQIAPGRLDVVYEARFTPSCVNFAIAPGPVLKSVHSKLSARWTIASNDVSVSTRVNEVKLNEVRMRVNMFNGAATLEVDADKIGGYFRNALFPKDLVTIGDCLKIFLGAIGEVLPKDPVNDHNLKFLMFVKLLDEPRNNQAFLSKFLPPQLQGISGGEMHPGVKFELESVENKSISAFEVSRAYGAQEDLFMTASVACLEGSPLATVDQRVDNLVSFIYQTWDRLGLTTGPRKDAS